MDEESTIKRNGLFRDIIINHLDGDHHERILYMNDPRVVLEKLKGYKRSETNITHSSVKTRLYKLKIGNNEKIYDFCERFDSIIRQYENCEGAVLLTDQEKISAFYQAVSGSVPELRSADLIRMQTNNREYVHSLRI